MHATPASLLVRLRNPGAKPEEQEAWRQSWNRFLELYTPLIYFWARRQVGLKGEEAADLVQEVFVKLLEEIPAFEYDPAKSFRGWLRRMLINRWLELRRRRPVLLLADGSDSDLEKVPAAADVPTFEEAEYCQYVAGRAWDLVRGEFEPTTQMVFDRVVRQNRPVAEVAAELHMTPAAVYKAKSRVLQRVREEFGDFLD
jgi:RNA polymerase sigma-70 factor, ECF subfamily